MIPGILYIVSTPIGNFQDITLRAIGVLKKSDAVICEDYRQGTILLKKIGINDKELILLNEHNEKEESAFIAQEILDGKRYALISDCGTPAFADPGTELIRLCFELNIDVVPIPGVSSLMAAISLSPLPMEEFHFAGFLPRKKEARKKKLIEGKQMQVPIIFMDAPYRLTRLLSEVREVFGRKRLVTLAFDLTLPNESILHGPVDEVLNKMKEHKGEFILIVYP